MSPEFDVESWLYIYICVSLFDRSLREPFKICFKNLENHRKTFEGTLRDC